MSLGEEIKKARKEKKLTLVQLGELTNLTQGYLSNIEGNKRKPSPDILKKLSEVLNVPYEKLMELAGYIEKSDLDKLEEAITKLESWLYTRYTQKKYWDSLKEGEIKGEEAAIYDNNEKFINAFELSLLDLKKLRDQITGPFEKIEGVENIIRNALYPRVDYEFEQPERTKLKIPKLNHEEYKSLENATHDFTFTFSTPAAKKNIVNGKEFLKPIPRKKAEQSFYDIENLLNLDKVYYEGRKLSSNDIEKILTKIEEIKDEFEYQD